jgi:hypothetical protein
MTTSKFAVGTPFRYIHNDLNKTFMLSYVYNTGTDNDKTIGPAIEFMSMLGSDRQSVGNLKKEFYKLGVSYELKAGRDRLIVKMYGLEENLAKGLDLLTSFILRPSARQRGL